MIFPSMTGTLQDPNNLGKKWRRVRDELGVFDVTTHSFGKTFVMLIEDKGLSARIASDQLGHSKVSMTTDRYMARGRIHTEDAELIDLTVNDERIRYETA